MIHEFSNPVPVVVENKKDDKKIREERKRINNKGKLY